mmetsp:Transcript_25184/g.41445  ORF Transcript_25184/g.41445 Transcript_25184/m.41445 type:complete len:328 (+) Transcript_25184:222-1205(+)|eukprot:CAMPEP_0184673888 /NCGR_PEP_ID=MMETSP0308-20130426/86929_1 /TAXON_ID=38269 /ORGANISM="Gloeochaete witrockiana, Strain SAG 46.84" /LENGTH=327 /DNA_ID=CAMNT_0027121425 /DNA_START=134 /DNA_END=1117 /DNA_ORIENTATION=-
MFWRWKRKPRSTIQIRTSRLPLAEGDAPPLVALGAYDLMCEVSDGVRPLRTSRELPNDSIPMSLVVKNDSGIIERLRNFSPLYVFQRLSVGRKVVEVRAKNTLIASAEASILQSSQSETPVRVLLFDVPFGVRVLDSDQKTPLRNALIKLFILSKINTSDGLASENCWTSTLISDDDGEVIFPVPCASVYERFGLEISDIHGRVVRVEGAPVWKYRIYQHVMPAALVGARPSSEVDSRTTSLRDRAPHDFFCPITLEIMRDPVTTADQITYERASISRWLGTGNSTSPKTNVPLRDRDLVPNMSLRAQIHTWLAEQYTQERTRGAPR